MSGIVKGIGHAVKGIVKGVVGFVKKYWVAIVVAAAIVFTAGIASVGVGAWSSAMSAGASSGFGGFMGAVGSTFSAGAAALTGGAIGSTVGLTSLAGSAGATAGGAVAGFGGATSFDAAEGITAGTNVGAAAGSGFAADSATGALAGGAGASTGALAGGIAGDAGSAGFNALTGVGTYAGPGAIAAAPTAITAPSAAASSLASGASGAANAAGAGASGAANAAGSGAAGAAPAAGHSFLGGLLNSKAGGALILTAGDMLQGAAQGKIAEQQFNETKPLGAWGVGLRGNATDAPVNNPFAPGEGLTSAASTNPFTPLPTQGNQQPLQQISPYVPDARALLPNGQQWMPNLPNANQGLMTVGWNTQTGQPVYSNTPATQSPGY